MRYHRTSLKLLALVGLVLPASHAMAQNSSEGVVQLGHCDADSCVSADYCDGCGDGYGSLTRRNLRRSRRACGGNAGMRGFYGYGDSCSCRNCLLTRWLNAHSPYHRCTYPADHGFAPPAHRPIRPRPAMYTRMYGQSEAADPGYRHPTVYMPTDTTQLGFYYQQVPYWRPRAGMIPPVPHPGEWHTPDTGVVFTGYQDAAAYGACQNCQNGSLIGGGSVVDGPVDQGVIESQPVPSTPTEADPVPMHDANPPYSPEPVNPQAVPPAEAPAPPGPAAAVDQDLETSAAAPLLIPVPPQ